MALLFAASSFSSVLEHRPILTTGESHDDRNRDQPTDGEIAPSGSALGSEGAHHVLRLRNSRDTGEAARSVAEIKWGVEGGKQGKETGMRCSWNVSSLKGRKEGIVPAKISTISLTILRTWIPETKLVMVRCNRPRVDYVSFSAEYLAVRNRVSHESEAEISR